MTSVISKYVFKRILDEGKRNNQGRDDPYFETVPTRRMGYLGGKEMKMKKRKKALPPGLSETDQKTLVKVKRRAYRLDMALGTICGIKIGWGSVIGIVPMIGDVADSLLALMVLRTAMEAQLPQTLVLHMFLNIAFDFIVGLVPFAGDVADMWYKANTRNAILLENYLRRRGAESIRKQGLPNQPDLSLGDEMEEQEDMITTQPVAHPEPTAPRGFFGSRRQKEPDIEAQRPADAKHVKHSKHSDEPAKHSKSKSTMKGASEGPGRTGVQESGIVRGHG